MLAGLAPLLLVSALAAPLDQGGFELRYSGALSRAGRDGQGTTVKRFNVYCAVLPQPDGSRELAYVLDERGGGGWAWPERFAVVQYDSQLKPVGSNVPRLLYDHNGTPTIVPLPLPIFSPAESLKSGAQWTNGKESWEVSRTEKLQDRTCWQINVSSNFGRKRTLWVDTEAPLVVSLEERVFIGQGEEFSVKLQLESAKPLAAEQVARVSPPIRQLAKLQTELQRAEGETRPELTAEQLKLASAAAPELQKAAIDTAFNDLALAVTKDVKAQMQRGDDVEKLAQKYVGQTAPPLQLTALDKQVIDAETLKDKIVVLHFWEYQGEPLIEPYGQVGYLDFMFSKRRKLGVQVVGIAVDSRAGDPQTTSAAVRSVQKLNSFMNLAYPIVLDDGKLLSRFGDPRKAGAKLPLWVIVMPDGKIAYYHTGFFKVNPDEGLRELDEVLVKLIKEHKGKK